MRCSVGFLIRFWLNNNFMFCDQVEVSVIAGKGGDGFVGFRREKYVPHGGPDGGNGGNGGNVILRVNSNLNSLIDIKKQKFYRADPGVNGHRFDMAGRAGEDLFLEVPPGTLVYSAETGALLADLVVEGRTFTVAKGGRGGHGNAHFASSVRQAPDFAEFGEPGQQVSLRLEMQMVADVGIIGIPSVGKSTLISRITDAKPKIADYPFTTLIPNMGVVDMSRWGSDKGETFVVADVPGLIEGAHEGKGLGHEFLRHVSRTAILLHVLDCQAQDPFKDYETLMKELSAYREELATRPQVLVVNKIDTLDESTRDFLKEEVLKYLKKKKLALPVFMISAVTGEGLKPVLFHLLGEVRRLKAVRALTPLKAEEVHVFRPHLERDPMAFEVIKEGNAFVVKGGRIQQIAVMTDFLNPSAVMRVHDVLEKMDIARALRGQGAVVGDRIKIGEATLEFRG